MSRTADANRRLHELVDACPDRIGTNRCARGLGADPDYPERVDVLRCFHCVSGQLQPPGLMARVASFAGAMVSHLAAGSPHASEAVQAARLAICRSCEFHREGECRVCGCPDRGVRLRASWADQSCPLDPPRWGPVEAD